MKKKLIALLLATATIVSACGAEAKESDEEDVETIDEEESSKSDEAVEDDDDDEGDGNGLFGLGDGAATTDTNEPAAAETQTAGDARAASDAQTRTVTYIDDASVTVEQSDVNANLWVITNTSTTTYHIQPKEEWNGDMIVDSSFAPGEVLYYFATSDDGARDINLDLKVEHFQTLTACEMLRRLNFYFMIHPFFKMIFAYWLVSDVAMTAYAFFASS